MARVDAKDPARTTAEAAAHADGMVAEWMQPLVEALDHASAEQTKRDPFRRDPKAIEGYLPYLKTTARYFGSEVRGFERLPEQGPFLIVGNHSGGAETNDMAALMARWIDERGLESPIYSLAYDLLFAYPMIGPMLPKLGIVPANHENGRRALAMGGAVVVFPGGDHEVFRPWSHRNRIEFGGHRGFVTLALEAGVPVVPMTIHGAHESTFVLTRGEEIARRLGLTRLHVKVFPMIFNIPFGITPAFVPTMQLPSKITIELGEPLDWSHHGADKAHDPGVLETCYEEITGIMQRTLDALSREHPHPVLERLNELRPINIARRLLGRR